MGTKVEKAVQKMKHRSNEHQGAVLQERSRPRAGVCILRNNEFRHADPGCAELLGRSGEELSGRNVEEIVLPEDLRLLSESLRTLESGENAAVTVRFGVLAGNKGVRYVELSGVQVTDRGRAAAGGTVKDITRTKMAEEAVKRFDEILAAKRKPTLGPRKYEWVK